MKWLRNLLHKPKPQPVLNDGKLAESVEAVLAPVEPVKPKPRGRVIKETRRPEFDPTKRHGGGRIVKAMPRQLQKMKQAQDKIKDDDEQPRIEDLED